MTDLVVAPAAAAATPAPAKPAKAAAAAPAKAAPAAVSKAAAAFEGFAFPKIDVPEAFRGAAETASKQAKEGFEKFRAAAEEASDVIEDTFETTRSGVVAFNTKAIEAAQANTEASFKFARELITVKTFSDAIELQTSFLRSQYETVTAQVKQLQEVATKVAAEAAQPGKDAFAKLAKFN